ncbi:MAG: hypothetical protein ACR2OZ_10150 [Verrucomicrobiales bacterium]
MLFSLRICVLLAFLIAMVPVAPAAPAAPAAPKTDPGAESAVPAKREPKVPDDLLQDEHLREEFGVNEFTAPSIKKLFAELAALGPLPYEKLRRDIPRETPRDRIRVALSLGMLIADGFLMVHSEKISEFENVGRGVLKHAKVLGAGDRISRHTKTILENSVDGDWDTLKNELAKTQIDVEAEMVLLRDVEIAHLISLGGWIRALEITSTAALDPFSEQKARKLARADLVEYFILGLDDLPPRLKDRDPLKTLREGVQEIQRTLEVPEGQALTAEAVEKLRKQSNALVKFIGADTKK